MLMTVIWDNFRDANEALRGLGLTYWADCGTLLGIIREGGLLDHDRDVDFGVFGVEKHRELAAWMHALGFKTYYFFGTPRRGYEQSFVRRKSKVDVFYFYPSGDKLWCGSWWKKKKLIVSEFDNKNHFIPTRQIYVNNELVHIPARPERVLEARYGDWRTTQKKWRWYRDPPCIRPDTLPPLAEMEAYEHRR